MSAGALAWTLRVLLSVGLGHVAAIALVAGAVVTGLAPDRMAMQGAAGALLLVAAAILVRRRTAPRVRGSAGRAGLALGSFIVSVAHGAGLMLVPALAPLCLSAATARAASIAPLFSRADVAFRAPIALTLMRTR